MSVERSVMQRAGRPGLGRTDFGMNDPIKQRMINEIKGYNHDIHRAPKPTSVPRFSKEWFSKYGGWAALNAVGAVMDYNQSRSEGHGVVRSAASAAGWFAAGEMLGFKMVPLVLGAQIPGLMVNGIASMDRMTRNMAMTNMYKNTPFFNARFQDTQAAYTMRQAGMQQAKNSQYRLEQAMMGNEAQYMRR